MVRICFSLIRLLVHILIWADGFLFYTLDWVLLLSWFISFFKTTPDLTAGRPLQLVAVSFWMSLSFLYGLSYVMAPPRCSWLTFFPCSSPGMRAFCHRVLVLFYTRIIFRNHDQELGTVLSWSAIGSKPSQWTELDSEWAKCTYTHTHTHICIYVCVCMSVSLYKSPWVYTNTSYIDPT